jgi:predicted double-glycine peptidase
MAERPPSAIPSDVDLRQVFASPHLKGLGGFKPIPQSLDHTCGAACVAAVIRYLGGSANEGQAAQVMGTNRVIGTKAEEMVTYLKGRSYKARGYYNVTLRAVIDRVVQGRISIVGWNDYDGHWVVVAGVEPIMRVIVLADPARARSHFACHTWEVFEKHWQCHVLGRGKKQEHMAIFVDRYNPAVRHYKKTTDRDRTAMKHPIRLADWAGRNSGGDKG